MYGSGVASEGHPDQFSKLQPRWQPTVLRAGLESIAYNQPTASWSTSSYPLSHINDRSGAFQIFYSSIFKRYWTLIHY